MLCFWRLSISFFLGGGGGGGGVLGVEEPGGGALFSTCWQWCLRCYGLRSTESVCYTKFKTTFNKLKKKQMCPNCTYFSFSFLLIDQLLISLKYVIWFFFLHLFDPCSQKCRESNIVGRPVYRGWGGAEGFNPPPPPPFGSEDLFFFACQRGWWCTIGTPTLSLENWPQKVLESPCTPLINFFEYI